MIHTKVSARHATVAYLTVFAVLAAVVVGCAPKPEEQQAGAGVPAAQGTAGTPATTPEVQAQIQAAQQASSAERAARAPQSK